MKKYIMPRGTGKTFQLMYQSHHSGDSIVCGTLAEARVIQMKAKKAGLNIPFPITYKELINGNYKGKRISGFLIDNVDRFFQTLTKVPVNAISLNP